MTSRSTRTETAPPTSTSRRADLGLLTTGSFDGILVAVLFDSDLNQAGPIFYANAPANGSTVELPVLASTLGLGTGHGKFSYQVLAENLNTGGSRHRQRHGLVRRVRAGRVQR